MTEVERSIYFYKVEMEDGSVWSRADVLRGLDALTGDDRFLSLGNDNYAWVKVDHIPRGREAGRARLFRDRRSNLPGYADQGTIAELPIPAKQASSSPRTWSSGETASSLPSTTTSRRASRVSSRCCCARSWDST